MQKFLVLYMAPAASLEEWMKQEPEARQADEEKMKGEWDVWMQSHGALHTGMTAGAGKTKRVTESGIADVKNDVMLFSIIEAESHEAAAAAFEVHPHFGIPGGWIDVMPANVLPGMEGV
jgi:hypothetical protein